MQSRTILRAAGAGLATLALSGMLLMGLPASARAAPALAATRQVEARGPGQGRPAPRALAVRALVQATAELTGQTPAEVMQALAGGQSLAQIAAANGSSGEAVVDAVAAKLEERLDQAVGNGRMTQDRADQVLAEFRTRAAEAVNDTTLGTRLRGAAAEKVRARAGRELVTITADLTGLTKQAIVEQLRAGQSLAQIASANGSSGDAVVAAMVTRLDERLDQAVANGRMTAEQAAELLAQGTTRLTEAVNRAGLKR